MVVPTVKGLGRGPGTALPGADCATVVGVWGTCDDVRRGSRVTGVYLRVESEQRWVTLN